MKPILAVVGSAVLLVEASNGQQVLWQIPSGPSTVQYMELAPFCDYDGDGALDILERVILNPMTGGHLGDLRIVSGLSGATLWNLPQFPAIKMRYAGDADGDGEPDILMLFNYAGPRAIEIWSTATNARLWQVWAPPGTTGYEYGQVLLGNVDLNGDGRPDALVATSHSAHSTAYAYDHSGALLYTIPCRSLGRLAYSICNMGDMNGDGCDDFVLGCVENTGRGVLVLTSGRDGSDLRLSYGFVWGDYTCDHVTNLGDIDGDGVNDFVGFPAWFTYTAQVIAFSGATGNVIRSWIDFADSVVGGADFDVDLDGVPDLLSSYDALVAPNTYGLSRARSGRDGTELWRVTNQPYVPGSGTNNGYWGWARYAASLGTLPGHHYPTVAWMEMDWQTIGQYIGRVRAFHTVRIAQGPITGQGCASQGAPPWIGARRTATGARVTIAKAPPGAFAFLNLALLPQTSYAGLPLPIDLGPFGLAGCDLLVGPEAAYGRLLGTAGIDRGYAQVDLPLQLSTGTLGTSLAAQWLVLDPATLAYAATPRHELRGL